jgi:glycerol uptake facilitator-like aquaporin
LQVVFGHVSAGGNYPIDKPGGDWRAFVMEIVLTAILASVILNTATGGRSIGHNAAIAVGSTVALLGLFASPISGSSMNPATLGARRASWRSLLLVSRAMAGQRACGDHPYLDCSAISAPAAADPRAIRAEGGQCRL